MKSIGTNRSTVTRQQLDTTKMYFGLITIASHTDLPHANYTWLGLHITVLPSEIPQLRVQNKHRHALYSFLGLFGYNHNLVIIEIGARVLVH